MKVARSPGELAPAERAVAIGTFDGVHLGHRRVLEAARAAAGPRVGPDRERAAGSARRPFSEGATAPEGLTPTVVTFDPHPRTAMGNRVELLTTLERRLELLEAAGMSEALVVEFDLELARLAPKEFAERYLRAIGAQVVVAGSGFGFGHRRSGDLALLERLGFDARTVPLVDGVSSSAIRALLKAGEPERAARMLGRPPEVEGVVVAGDARGGTLGFPTANLRLDPDLLVPRYGIYAGSALGHRAALSIGVNPHYGGEEQRVEAFLLEFAGDLYGKRLVIELWRYLRDERAFASEEELVEQIAHDVEAAQGAEKPL